MQRTILHYPNLKTVLMVEEVIREADAPLSRNEIKRRLPTKVMHQTLNLILKYLEESGKIMDGSKGIVWVFNEDPRFKKILDESVRVG